MRTSRSLARSSDAVGLKSGSCPSARIFAPRFLQTPPHGDALALRYPSPPSGWDGTFTRQLPNMHGVPTKEASRLTGLFQYELRGLSEMSQRRTLECNVAGDQDAAEDSGVTPSLAEGVRCGHSYERAGTVRRGVGANRASKAAGIPVVSVQPRYAAGTHELVIKGVQNVATQG